MQGLVPARRLDALRQGAATPPTVATERLRRRQPGLLGSAINPRVADQFMDRVDFDGIGRLQGVRHELSDPEIEQLMRARTRPLTEVPGAVQPAEPRPERDGLMDLIAHLATRRDPAARALCQSARAVWLGEVVDNAAMGKLLSSAAQALSPSDPLQAKLAQLTAELARPKTLQQYHDNLHGRQFETALAVQLVQQPPAGTLRAMAQTNDFLLNHVLSMAPDDQEDTLHTIAGFIDDDPRPWFVSKPEIEAFVNDPGVDTLRRLLAAPADGLDLVKAAYIGHRVAVAANNTGAGLSTSDAAAAYYSEVVVPARTGARHQIQVLTDGPGIALAHQPAALTRPDALLMRSHTFGRAPLLDAAHGAQGGPHSPPAASSPDQPVLQQGAIFVSGPSGSTSVLTHVFQAVKQQDPEFSMGDAMLAGLMFMVFDGGHSVNEVLAGHHAIVSTHDFAERRRLLNQPHAYGEVARLAASPADQRHLQSLLDGALDDALTVRASLKAPS